MKKLFARIFGIGFILVGSLAFISNPLVGTGGFFHANAAHRILHIVLGIILVASCKNEKTAGLWLKIVGVAYLAIAVVGFFMTHDHGIVSIVGVEVNNADNWLHLFLALAVFFSGFAPSRKAVKY